MMRSSLWPAMAGLFALAAPTRADEIVLQDGRTLYGAVEERGNTLVIATRDGDVSVHKGEVVRTRKAEELRGELLGLASRCGTLTAFSCLHLANTARDWDLIPEMWMYLDRALAQQDTSTEVRARLHEFLGTLEPELLPRRFAKSPPAVKARELLFVVPSPTPDPRAPAKPAPAGTDPKVAAIAKTTPARNAAIAYVLASLNGVDEELRSRGRSNNAPHQRLVANRALWLRGETDAANRNFVLRSAVFDGDQDVRAGVIELVAGTAAAPAAVEYLTAGLVSKEPRVSMRTAEAVGALGEPSGLDALVKAAPLAAAAAEGGGARAHVSFLTQQSYIRDFDVEVAQSSFIADPKVDVLTSGSQLDVRVLAVETQRRNVVRAFQRAAHRLAGADPGEDPSTWAAWLAARRTTTAAR